MLTASIQFQKKKILNYALNGIKDNGRPGAHSQSPFHNDRTTKYCEVPLNISGSTLARINPKRACICEHLWCCIQLRASTATHFMFQQCCSLTSPWAVLLRPSSSAPPRSSVTLSRRTEHRAKGASPNRWLSGISPILGTQPRRGDKSDTKRFRRNEQAPQASWIYTSGEINKRCFLYTVVSHRVCIVSFIPYLTAGLLSPQGMIKP